MKLGQLKNLCAHCAEAAEVSVMNPVCPVCRLPAHAVCSMHLFASEANPHIWHWDHLEGTAMICRDCYAGGE